MLVLSCLLLVVASAVQAGSGHASAADRAVAAWCAAHQQPSVFAAFDTVTRLAAWQLVGIALIVVAGGVAVARRTVRPLVQAVLAALLVAVVTGVLKAAIHRPGPTGVTPPAYDGAWPSGHAVTIVVATVVLLRLFPAAPRRRLWVAVVAFLPAVMLGVALIYCGDHWLSDVGVAFPLGLLLGRAAFWAERLVSMRTTEPRGRTRS